MHDLIYYKEKIKQYYVAMLEKLDDLVENELITKTSCMGYVAALVDNELLSEDALDELIEYVQKL